MALILDTVLQFVSTPLQSTQNFLLQHKHVQSIVLSPVNNLKSSYGCRLNVLVVGCYRIYGDIVSGCNVKYLKQLSNTLCLQFNTLRWSKNFEDISLKKYVTAICTNVNYCKTFVIWPILNQRRPINCRKVSLLQNLD